MDKNERIGTFCDKCRQPMCICVWPYSHNPIFTVYKKCNLSNTELIKKVSELNSKLCKNGSSAWSMRVPPDPNKDSDLLIQELIERFEKLVSTESPQIKEKTIYDLGLHETLNAGIYTVGRVPGGWIYLCSAYDSHTTTFVPFNTEFK